MFGLVWELHYPCSGVLVKFKNVRYRECVIDDVKTLPYGSLPKSVILTPEIVTSFTRSTTQALAPSLLATS